jgi:hypothetical protein
MNRAIWGRGAVASSNRTAGSCAADQLKRGNTAVEPDIIAAIFHDHDAARVGDRGAVAPECPSNSFKAQPETDVARYIATWRAKATRCEPRSMASSAAASRPKSNATQAVTRRQMSFRLAAAAPDGAGGREATGDLSSSIATSLGIYTYILDETQIAGTAIPIKNEIIAA